MSTDVIVLPSTESLHYAIFPNRLLLALAEACKLPSAYFFLDACSHFSTYRATDRV
jgi:hypothetical protein